MNTIVEFMRSLVPYWVECSVYLLQILSLLAFVLFVAWQTVTWLRKPKKRRLVGQRDPGASDRGGGGWPW